MDIKTLRERLDSRQIGAEELLKQYLDKIHRCQDLNCYITVCEDTARVQARKAQKQIDEKKSCFLTGIPISVKDNICTVGIRTTCASKMLAEFVPSYDAFVIEQLKKQHTVLIGKTNMDEFAMGSSSQTSYFGGVKNPYDTQCVPGGSSGGAAAAVTARLCAGALGSDTGGSIRQPAAFCGVTGIKPTYGRISRFGLVAFASSLDQIGVIARSAYDAAGMLNAISGNDVKDASMSLRGSEEDFSLFCGRACRDAVIGLPREFFEDHKLNSQVKESVLAAAALFEAAGYAVVECSIPSAKHAVGAYYLLSSAEAASNLARFDGVRYGYQSQGAKSYEELVKKSRTEGFGKEVKRRILLGNYALSKENYGAYYQKASSIREQIRQECLQALKKFTMLLMPTVPEIAYPRGSREPVTMYAADRYTVIANLTGLPAVSTVCGYSAEGLPIGMSFMGRAFDEKTILGAADWFEQQFFRMEAVL